MPISIALREKLLPYESLFFTPTLKKNRNDQIGKMADDLAKSLQKESRVSIPDALTHPKVLAARKFFKTYNYDLRTKKNTDQIPLFYRNRNHCIRDLVL